MNIIKNLVLITLMIAFSNAKAEESWIESFSRVINKDIPKLAQSSEVKKRKRKQKLERKTKKDNKKNSLKKHKMMFGVGQLFLYNDFKGSDELTLDLEYVYSSQEKFDVTLDTHYFSVNTRKGEVGVWALAPSIKYNFYKKETITFYTKGAFGFYNIQEKESKWVFGTNFGVGTEVDLNNKYVVGMKWDYNIPFEANYSNGRSIDGSYMRLLVQAGYKF